jgi:hypothetical protein
MSEPESLIERYKQMAAGGQNFRGLSLLAHRETIRVLVRKTGARSILDWGAGAGDAYRPPNKLHAKWGIKLANVTRYDPAFKKYARAPVGQFDGVICSDVLEHIPEGLIEATVNTLFGHARKFVFASVCCRPAKKTFPGTDINLHVTVKPFHWWHGIFYGTSLRYPGVKLHLVEAP